MNTPELRKTLKAYYAESHQIHKEWVERGHCYPPPKSVPFPDEYRDMICGAKTRAGHPCKQIALYANGRCKFHGGLSTGPTSKAGKSRAALNGKCPKKKRTS